MKITEIDQLLADFAILPKKVKQPTYLEICKYPRRRFEEICSRMLCFYMAPDKEHGLGELFLYSLFQILAPGKAFHFQSDKVHIISEENAEGKRLDMLIYSNTFVVGIENKITARLYNPLEAYKNRIQLYGTDNIYRVILSLRKLSSKDDLAFIAANGFTNLTYCEYFQQIQQNLSAFIKNHNEKYLHHLNDFMETIENMQGNNILNEELSAYFFENAGEIDGLIGLYNQFKIKTKARQTERIADLKDKISNSTKTQKWWVWEGWDLGINNFNHPKHNIGIESYFEATKGNPCGLFRITITAWNLNDWNYYEEYLLKDYPNCELKKVNNRAFLHVNKLINAEDEAIIEYLKKHYEYLAGLTSSLMMTGQNVS